MNDSDVAPGPVGSTTLCVAALAAHVDREAAAAALWGQYFEKLVDVVRREFPGVNRSADAEDMAASAFKSVVALIEAGSDAAPANGDDLWGLLARRARWKCLNHLRGERALRRGGGVPNLSAVVGDGEAGAADLSAELAASLAAELRARLDALEDDMLRRIARLRLEGREIIEIAGIVGKSRATINRKLRLIRNLWRLEEPADAVAF